MHFFPLSPPTATIIYLTKSNFLNKNRHNFSALHFFFLFANYLSTPKALTPKPRAYTQVDLADPNSSAVVSYQIKVETAALVRSAENLLTLTRILKESWLFGKLQTVGGSEAERRAELSAVAVGESLTRLGIVRREGDPFEAV